MTSAEVSLALALVVYLHRRKKTVKAKVPLTGKMAVLVTSMASMLDARMAFRLSIIMAGMMLADDRRVAAAWFAAAGVHDDWDRFYDCLISIGGNARSLAVPVVIERAVVLDHP